MFESTVVVKMAASMPVVSVMLPRLVRSLGSRAFPGCRFEVHSGLCLRGQAFRTISPLYAKLQPASTLPTSTQNHYSFPKDVLQSVNSEIDANYSRLFAIIQISGKQYKVTTNDLIQTYSHIDADVGDRIRLEKVLMAGGENFTILGKPLIRLDVVKVEATVIEKTKGPKIVIFKFIRRKRFKKYKERNANHTVLRINSIEVAPVS
ncbi:39S ribosomal protein L21, mitochondrial-like [Anneissia japonica]|uniref:39S ribosomal protein L21, mitochondrial-like n=1 Tax=Anneissia japonica TaxID=1529436 RepID=UPI0014257581|nr:39S ribosomal protein L21, mitochondrial-like [Anneissia japonica]